MDEELVRQARARNLDSLPYKMGWAASRDVERLLKEALAKPVPPPFWGRAGAFFTNAGPADFNLLWQGGFRLLAPQIHWASGHDPSTIENLRLIRDDGWAAKARLNGFQVGGWGISTGVNALAEANYAASLVKDLGLDFYIADTERHKTDLGGKMEWAELLYAQLRQRLGNEIPLGNVTWGIHSSPQVINHEAMRRYNVQYLPEAYDGSGNTVSMRMTVEKANEEGWKPAVPVLGDKHYPAGTLTLSEVGKLGLVRGFWLWAAEQAQDTGYDSIRAACLNGAAAL